MSQIVLSRTPEVCSRSNSTKSPPSGTGTFKQLQAYVAIRGSALSRVRVVQLYSAVRAAKVSIFSDYVAAAIT
jgi:hypothetical protein